METKMEDVTCLKMTSIPFFGKTGISYFDDQHINNFDDRGGSEYISNYDYNLVCSRCNGWLGDDHMYFCSLCSSQTRSIFCHLCIDQCENNPNDFIACSTFYCLTCLKLKSCGSCQQIVNCEQHPYEMYSCSLCGSEICNQCKCDCDCEGESEGECKESATTTTKMIRFICGTCRDSKQCLYCEKSVCGSCCMKCKSCENLFCSECVDEENDDRSNDINHPEYKKHKCIEKSYIYYRYQQQTNN